jgi:Ca2+-binding EF-hand superfamily protein
MGKQGRKLTKTQIDKLMKETDADGDGKISYEEFFNSMVKNG